MAYVYQVVISTLSLINVPSETDSIFHDPELAKERALFLVKSRFEIIQVWIVEHLLSSPDHQPTEIFRTDSISYLYTQSRAPLPPPETIAR